jgi:hypothetical protein
MRPAFCAAAVAAAVVVGACGGSDDAPQPGLTASQAHSLAVPLDQARQAGAGRDLDGTLGRLHAFRVRVAALRRAGALDAATAKRLRVGAMRAEARARDELAPPPAQPAVTTPAPAPAPPKKKGKEKTHGKHGKGKKD